MNRRLHSQHSTDRTTMVNRPSGRHAHIQPRIDHASTFEQLRRRLMQNRLRSVEDFHRATQVKWASDEASSLSWTTGFPLLFYPLLFEEKSSAALDRARRQDEIHARSRELLGLHR